MQKCIRIFVLSEVEGQTNQLFEISIYSLVPRPERFLNWR